MKHIIIDPGHGGTEGKDHFRSGPSGEREEWINLSVAKELKHRLEAKGFAATLTRRNDIDISLQARVDVAAASQADLFLSVHHASCDPVIESINFPFFFFHSSDTVQLNSDLLQAFKKGLSLTDRGVAIGFSDNWVFEEGLFVLRQLSQLKIPALITEFSFFSHIEEEQKLKTREYCQYEAEILCHCIEIYFSSEEKQPFYVGGLEEVSFPQNYKKELNQKKQQLLESSPSFSWEVCMVEAEQEFFNNNYSGALIKYKQALAWNPFHQKIEKQLNHMLACTIQLKDASLEKNISDLLSSIY